MKTMTTGQLLFLEDPKVKQFKTIGKSVSDYDGKFYVVAHAVGERGEVNVYYLQTNCSWGRTCIDKGLPTGYFASAAEAEQVLVKSGPVRFHERAVHGVELDFMAAWKIANAS